MHSKSVTPPSFAPIKLAVIYLAVAAISLSALFSPALMQQARAQSLLRDAEIEQWIFDYSYPILEAAEIDPKTIDFLIVGDPTPNAFAGGRTMGIFTGLITTADTPNQVEGVIAHEVGHLKGEHSTRRADAFANASRPILLSLVLAAAAVAAGAPEAGLGILGLGQQIGTVNALAYSQSNESTADASALRYLNKIGRSGQGLIEFFGKLRNPQIIRARKINPYLTTHPLATQRVTALTENVNASSYFEVKDSDEDLARFRLIQAKIQGFLQSPNTTLRQYPLSDKSQPGRYARAVAFYRSADIDRALTEINSLLAEKEDNPYFQELKGQMLFESGRVKQSVEPHRRSVELAPNKALLRVNLGRAMLATQERAQVEQAIPMLKSALLLERSNSFGWYELARAHSFMGDEGSALLCTAESKYFAGSKGEAIQFARRSLPHFKRGSREWLQAQDIMVAVSSTSKRSRSNRPRLPTPPAPEKQTKEQQKSPEEETLPETEKDTDVDQLPEAPKAKKG